MNKIKYFQAAMADKLPDITLGGFSASLGVDEATFKNFIETSNGLPAFTINVLNGLLGSTVDEFIEYGRSLSAQPQPTPLAVPSTAGTQEEDQLLAQARAILSNGGDRAQTLKTIITLLAQ